MKRRPFLLLCATLLLAGCSSWNLFSSSKSKTPSDTPDDQPHTVGDLAIPFGMFPVKVEAVGLVSGLHGTGSDPEPSPQRAMLMAEMQRRGVENPNQLLATRNYSLVLVRGFLRPGIQKGDHFDVELRVKDRSETTSLRGGYLLETRLSDMAVIYGKVLDGKVRGIAQGPVLVDPSATEKHNSVQLGRGVVLGGGVARESRSVGLFLNGAEETNMTPGATPQCGREKRPGGQRHQSPLQHAQERNQSGRRPGDPRQLRRPGRRSGLQGQSGPLFPGIAGDRAARNVGRD